MLWSSITSPRSILLNITQLQTSTLPGKQQLICICRKLAQDRMRYYAKLRCMRLRNTFTCPRPCRQQPYSGLSRPTVDVSRPYTHTQTHPTRYDFSVWGIGPSQNPLPDNTQHLQETCIPLGKIRTWNPSKRAAADLRLRPRDQPDRHITKYTQTKPVRYLCSRTYGITLEFSRSGNVTWILFWTYEHVYYRVRPWQTCTHVRVLPARASCHLSHYYHSGWPKTLISGQLRLSHCQRADDSAMPQHLVSVSNDLYRVPVFYQ